MAARWSTRSSIVGSAQCRSSNATTSGPRAAMFVSTRRRPQKSSSTGYAASVRPTAAAARSAAAVSPSASASSFARARSSGSSSSTPARSRSASAMGQKVIPWPYERQRPRVTVVPSGTVPRNSATRRDLPAPAAATIFTSRAEPEVTAASSSPRRVASSSARPTSGEAATGAADAARMPISLNAGIGSDLPLSASGSTGSRSATASTRSRVSGPISTSLVPAACSSRAATLTASPVTSRWPAAGSPDTTSPVLTPVRFWRVTPKRSWSSAFNPASAACIPAAARTARSASSSCRCGRPNTAITASPMNFSTVPPWRSSSSRITSK